MSAHHLQVSQLPANKSPFVRSDNDVGKEGLAHSFSSNSPQKCSSGLTSDFCAGQSSSSTTNWLICVFIDLCLQSVWNQKGLCQNLSHTVGSIYLCKYLGMLKH
ncbi:hypothetical protein CHARACLAT_010937 [Characodon lateralis]|uniref:Uncharacterized protein n=1 Tax=Characodon lateralis TaxID=208331 RepID=A0ABU7F4H5_9TELE|nr:hypothetical protein [Characodon lateralis]